MNLQIDFAVIYNKVFEEIEINPSLKKLYVKSSDNICPLTSLIQSSNSLKNENIKDVENPKYVDSKSFKNIDVCYSLSFKNIQIIEMFKFSVYYVMKLKYQRWHLLKENVNITVFFVCFSLEKLINSLNLLIDFKIKTNSSIKNQLKKLKEINLIKAQINYLSEKKGEIYSEPRVSLFQTCK